MLYPELFQQFESVRWTLESDVPWQEYVAAKLTDDQARTIKMNAITEWSALPATEMFLRDNPRGQRLLRVHVDLVLRGAEARAGADGLPCRFRPELVPTEDELDAVRFEFDPAPALETLMLHFCGEVRLSHWYRRASEWHTEPVIKRIYELIARDEARHAGAYLRFMKRAIERSGDEAKRAFAKIGVLMASSRRGGKPLHATNLHVNTEAVPERHGAKPDTRPGVARALAQRQIRVRRHLRKARDRHDPAQSVEPVRADVRVGPAAEPLPKVARACLMTLRAPVAVVAVHDRSKDEQSYREPPRATLRITHSRVNCQFGGWRETSGIADNHQWCDPNHPRSTSPTAWIAFLAPCPKRNCSCWMGCGRPVLPRHCTSQATSSTSSRTA